MESYPIEESPEIVQDSDVYDTDFHYSVLWDYEKMDFARNGDGNMIKCGWLEAFKAWCVKTVYTERYTCFAYPDTIGAELDSALGQEDNAAVEACLQNTIRDAIMVNPRTYDVRDFSFSWEGDSLHCTFTVEPTLGHPFNITI